jgi:hypothetical protein
MIKGTYISGSMDGLDIKTKFNREHICFNEKHEKTRKKAKNWTKRDIYIPLRGFSWKTRIKTQTFYPSFILGKRLPTTITCRAGNQGVLG